MKWSDALCPSCRKTLHPRKVYCPHCRLPLIDRIQQDATEEERTKTQRTQRQHQDFLHEFDKRAFELVLTKLKSLEKVTVSDLIDILVVEGFFEKYKSGHKGLDGVVYFLPVDLTKLKFVGWARKRVLGLAKWWAKNEVAFIGAQVSQGHPYLFYLGKQPDALFDPLMPKKSIAQRSVNKVAQTIESIEKGSSNHEVSV